MSAVEAIYMPGQAREGMTGRADRSSKDYGYRISGHNMAARSLPETQSRVNSQQDARVNYGSLRGLSAMLYMFRRVPEKVETHEGSAPQKSTRKQLLDRRKCGLWSLTEVGETETRFRRDCQATEGTTIRFLTFQLPWTATTRRKIALAGASR